MLINEHGHIKLTDFGLSTIRLSEQEGAKGEQFGALLSRKITLKAAPPKKNGANRDSTETTNRGTSVRRGKTRRGKDSDKSVLGTPDYLAPVLTSRHSLK